jgi:acetylornithine/succinyldiaminopimelate/putrescine aminotransferase
VAQDLSNQRMTFGKSKKRCQQVGALLIIDEIQPGFGRTGKLFS